jgi:hypothetical protein
VCSSERRRSLLHGRRLLLQRLQRLDQPFATQDRLHAGNPAAPAQLRHHHRDQSDRQAQQHDEGQQVAARVQAAAVHEAQVVQHHQAVGFGQLAMQRIDAHMHRAG